MAKVLLTTLLTLAVGFSFCQQRKQLDLLVKAERTLAEGDTAKSLEQFQNVLQRFPQNYAAIVRLGEVYFAKKDYDRSSQYIYLGIDIVEKLLEQQTQGINQKQMPQRMVMAKDLQRRYQSDLAGLFHLLGLNRNRQERYHDAIEAFGKSISLNNKASVHIDKALSYLQIQNFQSAVSALHHSRKLDSTFYKSYYNLANIYNQSRQYDSAIYYYKKTIAKNDSLKWPYLYLAQLYTNEQKLQNAIEKLTQFIQLDSSLVEPYFRRAILYTNEGDFVEALRDWNVAVKLDSNNAEGFRNRGLTYFYLENFEKAIEDFNQSLALKPDEPYTLINRGYSHYLSGESAKALEDVNSGIEGLPKYALGHYIRALVHLDLKKKKKACLDLKKALELGYNEDEVSKKLMKKCF